MSRAHFFLDFLIQCNVFIYSEIHSLYYYGIYFDLSVGQFISASCMSWMSAICVHANGNILYGMNENSLLRSRFQGCHTTLHPVQCSSPWGGALCDDLKNGFKGDYDEKDLS